MNDRMLKEKFHTDCSTNEFSLNDFANIARVYMKKPSGCFGVYAWKDKKKDRLVVQENGVVNSEMICQMQGIKNEMEAYGRRVVYMSSWHRENLKAYPIEASLFRMGNPPDTADAYFRKLEREALKELSIEARR